MDDGRRWRVSRISGSCDVVWANALVAGASWAASTYGKAIIESSKKASRYKIMANMAGVDRGTRVSLISLIVARHGSVYRKSRHLYFGWFSMVVNERSLVKMLGAAKASEKRGRSKNAAGLKMMLRRKSGGGRDGVK